ncbi:MAG: T9SS type A sorting domain-containing protein [Bacteroidia bacterium]
MKTKQLLLSLALIICAGSVFAQWSNKGFTFEGNARQYRMYVPPMYDANTPVSLVLALHGLGDNMTNFSGIGMKNIADTANIIFVVPQALADPLAGTAWNSGAGFLGYFPNSNIDDVGFISALIDTISANYAINSQNIFCCGFSMGGFMTERLACQLSHKIRSFASVAGTFGSAITCEPWRSVCVLHFHGTADATVPYTGGDYGISADSLINFWVANNQCTTDPQIDSLPNTMSDGYTVEKYTYGNGNDNTRVNLYKVDGADHTWLTNANDVSYSVEIWKFFSSCGGVLTGMENTAAAREMEVFPNPAGDVLTIRFPDFVNGSEYSVTLTDFTGKVVLTSTLKDENTRLDLKANSLAKGIYFLNVAGRSKKIVIE